MARQLVIPLGNYQNGTRSFGPVAIDDAVTRVGFALARCTTATPTIWPNATATVDLKVECSVDGGASWISCGGFTAQGGIHVHRDGHELTESWYRTNLPPGTNRQGRGTLTIAGGPIRTSGEIIIE